MTWLDITGLTPGQVRMLESDERAGFTPDVLLFEDRDCAQYNLWQYAN